MIIKCKKRMNLHVPHFMYSRVIMRKLLIILLYPGNVQVQDSSLNEMFCFLSIKYDIRQPHTF